MTESLQDLKKTQLTTRLAHLSQEYSAAWAQLGQTLGGSEELRIKRTIEELESKIREAETQLKALEPEHDPATAHLRVVAPMSKSRVEQPARVAGVAGKLSFRNFDLRIRQTGWDSYSVETNSELAGQAEAIVPTEVFHRVAENIRVVHSVSLVTGRIVGSLLYDAAFPPLIRERFALAQGRLLRGEGLRIRLQMDPPAVAALPWEMMYNPDPIAPAFVSLSPALSLIRFLPTARRAQPVAKPPPLRLVLTSAQPTDLVRLAWDAEVDLIRKSLDSVEASIQFEVENNLSIDVLTDRLSDDFDILHFGGHGYVQEDRQLAGILVEDHDRRAVPLEADVLAQLLDGSSVRLVFLNSNESARTLTSVGVGGLAQALVGAGVSTVVGWSGPVSDIAGARFAAEFYRGLARRLPLDTCVLFGRRALYTQSRENIEWPTVQLITRAHDLNLFAYADTGGS